MSFCKLFIVKIYYFIVVLFYYLLFYLIVLLLLKYSLLLLLLGREISVINGEDSKKHRENSDSASLLPDDVFSDGFNSPECAKILINCLKSIELQVKELFVLCEDTKNSQIKGEKQLDSLAEVLELLSANLMSWRKTARRKIRKFLNLRKKLNR